MFVCAYKSFWLGSGVCDVRAATSRASFQLRISFTTCWSYWYSFREHVSPFTAAEEVGHVWFSCSTGAQTDSESCFPNNFWPFGRLELFRATSYSRWVPSRCTSFICIYLRPASVRCDKLKRGCLITQLVRKMFQEEGNMEEFEKNTKQFVHFVGIRCAPSGAFEPFAITSKFKLWVWNPL